MLARGVGGAAGARPEARRRVDEHDQTTAGTERGQQSPGQEVRSADVDRELEVEVLDRRRFERTRAENAGGVNEQVHAIAQRLGGRAGLRDSRLAGEVSGEGPNGAALRLEFLTDRPQPRLVPAQEQQGRPFRGERPGDRPADRAGGPGHDRYPIGEPRHGAELTGR